MKEKWKNIVGFDGIYAISNKGRVRNNETGRIMKQTDTGTAMSISINSTIQVPKLVLEHFAHKDKYDTNKVVYRDGDYTNVDITNVQWKAKRKKRYKPGKVIKTGPRRSIPGYNKYEVSKYGRVIRKSYKYKSKKAWSDEKEIMPSNDGSGYERLNLISNDGSRRRITPGRAVELAWGADNIGHDESFKVIKTGPRRSIPGYNKYEVSKDGRIIRKSYKYKSKESWSDEKELTPSVDNAGYQRINLTGNDGVRRRLSVHRIVALAWLDNPNDYPQVHHKDHRKNNNHVDNLEWVTHRMNIQAAYDAGEYEYQPVKVRIYKEDEEGNVIEEHEFETIYMTAKFLDTFPSHVSNVIHGKYGLKTIYGYKVEKL